MQNCIDSEKQSCLLCCAIINKRIFYISVNEFYVFAFSVNVCITNKRLYHIKAYTVQWKKINRLLNNYIYVHMLQLCIIHNNIRKGKMERTVKRKKLKRKHCMITRKDRNAWNFFVKSHQILQKTVFTLTLLIVILYFIIISYFYLKLSTLNKWKESKKRLEKFTSLVYHCFEKYAKCVCTYTIQ